MLEAFQTVDPLRLLCGDDEDEPDYDAYLSEAAAFIEGLRPVAWALFSPHADQLAVELVRRSFSVCALVSDWWWLEEPVSVIARAILPQTQRLCHLGLVR
ncbi:MAG TPA: hypothetical protein VLI05_05065 [Candidatus Saccharimonadia bacterium]|nr:hypothetical protein [Candidatus Saccharimonadia bacterium]